MTNLSDQTFCQFKLLLEKLTGILLADHKKSTVINRLSSRLSSLELSSFEEYLTFLHLSENEQELQIFVDKLTTHETYFYRESEQFEWLKEYLKLDVASDSTVSVWSAACATGEEVFSLAMLLQDVLGSANWNVFGTDISHLSVQNAQRAKFKIQNVSRIPSEYRNRYCLKGVGKYEGYFTFSKEIKERCFFSQESLLEPNDRSGSNYDIVFLRNVLIYFTPLKQKQIVQSVIDKIQLGGLLFLGHSENIVKDHRQLEQLEGCIFRKVSL